MNRVTTSIILIILALFSSSVQARPQESIRSTIWLDQNCNGIREQGEPPILQQPIWLISPGADGKANTSDDRMIEYASSGPNGFYRFTLGRENVEFSLRILEQGRSPLYQPAPLGPDNILRSDWTTAGFFTSDIETLTDKNIGLCQAQLIHLPMVMGQN